MSVHCNCEMVPQVETLSDTMCVPTRSGSLPVWQAALRDIPVYNYSIRLTLPPPATI